MTKKEYEGLHRTAIDVLGHTIKVGDTVIAYYGCGVHVCKVVRICPKRIVVTMRSRFEYMISTNNVIKIKNGIPED